jgi:hypothetical protein
LNSLGKGSAGEVDNRQDSTPAWSSGVFRLRRLAEHNIADGLSVHTFETFIADFASRGRNTYTLKSDDSTPVFEQVPVPTQLQVHVYELLVFFPVKGD